MLPPITAPWWIYAVLGAIVLYAVIDAYTRKDK